MSRSFSAILAAILVFSFTGCSWTFTKHVPDDYSPDQDLECSAYGWPVADTLFAGVLAVIAAAPPEGLGDSPRSVRWLSAGCYGAVSAVLLASAITGFVWSNECRVTRRTHLEFLANKREQLRFWQAEPEYVPVALPTLTLGPDEPPPKKKKPRIRRSRRRRRVKRSRKRKKKRARRRKRKKKRRISSAPKRPR